MIARGSVQFRPRDSGVPKARRRRGAKESRQPKLQDQASPKAWTQGAEVWRITDPPTSGALWLNTRTSFRAFDDQIDMRLLMHVIGKWKSGRIAEGENRVPLLVENDQLFLEAELEVAAGKTAKHKLRIDTGSESSVNDEIVRQSTELRENTLGGGLGENFKSCSGFQIDQNRTVCDQTRLGPGGPGPAIGMEILRRFILTFDVSRRRLYMEPTPGLTEPVPPPP